MTSLRRSRRLRARVGQSLPKGDERTANPPTVQFARRTQDVFAHLNVLCRKCQLISSTVVSVLTREQKIEPFTKSLKHHVNSKKLLDSAQEGCHLCSIVLRELGYAQREGLDENTMSFSYEMSSEYQSYGQSLHVKPHTSDIEGTGFHLRSHNSIFRKNVNGYGTVFELIPPETMLSVSTASKACFELANTWFRECMDNHQVCSEANRSENTLPCRLLSLRWVGDRIVMNLTSSAALPAGVKYVTLSHCWGHGKHLKLTNANIESFSKDLAMETLSQTFIDSMVVTLRMGLQYIWIDSLCIIQDDPDDLAKEIAKMCDIYRNGTLNVAAVHARDGDGGCFTERRPTAFQPCKMAHDGQQAWYAVPEDLPASSDMVRSSALFDRAWVMQEQALAPRTLFYTSEVMYWECLTCTASEMRPVMDHSFPVSGSAKHSLESIRRSNSLQNSSEWRSHWWSIANDYTKRKWTYNRDRWTAISGLADFFQRYSHEPILAGLWTRYLVRELCWRALQPSNRLESPSWSWLAVDAPVLNHLFESHQIFQKTVANIVAAPDASEAYSQKKNRPQPLCIVIRAPVVRFKCGLIDLSPPVGHVIYGMEIFEWHNWFPHQETSMKWYPDREFNEGQNLLALQIGHSVSIGRGPYVSDRYHIENYRGLVIVPVKNGNKSWARLGTFSITVDFGIAPQGPIQETLGKELVVKLE